MGEPAPDPICLFCSKPIASGTIAELYGRAIHMRCLTRKTQLAALEQEDRASRERQRGADRAEELVNAARRQTHCPVCWEPFAMSRGVLFQGDQLVHAGCWRAEPEPTTGSSPSA